MIEIDLPPQDRSEILDLFAICDLSLKQAPPDVVYQIKRGRLDAPTAQSLARMVGLCLRREQNRKHLDMEPVEDRRKTTIMARRALGRLQERAGCVTEHGKVIGPPPRHLCFGWAVDDAQYTMFLWDHDVGLSITNAAESVCRWATGVAPARYRLVYRDTTGTWSQLARRRQDGAFVGYAPGVPTGVVLNETLMRDTIGPTGH